MITRRNIRVKIMQTLYSLEAQENQKAGDAQKILQKHFDHTGALLVYLIYFLTELARYAETESLRRSSKHLPTDGDRNVNTKLAGNRLLWEMLEQESFRKMVKKYKPELIDHQDLIKKDYETAYNFSGLSFPQEGSDYNYSTLIFYSDDAMFDKQNDIDYDPYMRKNQSAFINAGTLNKEIFSELLKLVAFVKSEE